MTKARFITIEGGDGAGKSTQVALLRDALATKERAVITTREPGGSPGAEAIRALLVAGEIDRWDAMTEAMLHFAARRDHVRKLVRPALEKGTWVISDRFADSTIAYQGHGQGADLGALNRLQELALEGFAPDLTLVLDLPVARGLARAAARDDQKSRYERMDHGMHERLRQGFLQIAKSAPGRCAVIDADHDAETVHSAVMAAVRERLNV